VPKIVTSLSILAKKMYLNEATASGRKLHNKDIYKLHFPPDGSIFVSPGDIVNGKVGGGGLVDGLGRIWCQVVMEKSTARPAIWQ